MALVVLFSAVTVKVKPPPAAALTGALTTKWSGVTVEMTLIAALWPLMVLVTESVAVIVCGPPVFSVTLNVPTPAVSELLAGTKLAAASLLENSTLPA